MVTKWFQSGNIGNIGNDVVTLVRNWLESGNKVVTKWKQSGNIGVTGGNRWQQVVTIVTLAIMATK